MLVGPNPDPSGLGFRDPMQQKNLNAQPSSFGGKWPIFDSIDVRGGLRGGCKDQAVSEIEEWFLIGCWSVHRVP